jgi:drug/metabolite transporter (DMT)-like permease
LLTLLWGVNWPVMKAGVQAFPPLTFRMISILGGLVLLYGIARFHSLPLRIARQHWKELVVLSITNMALWYVLAIYGVKLLSSGRAAILGYTMPVWVALLGVILYRDRLDARMWLGVSSAALAIALLLSSEFRTIAGSPLGTVLMLSAAMTWGLGTQLMRRRTFRPPLVVLTFWMTAISFALCLPVLVVLEHHLWVRPPDAVEWGSILYNVFLIFGLAQLLWFRLVTNLPPVASGLSVMLIPVVGVLSGIVMLGERPGWHDYAALVCIIVSIATVLLMPQRETTSTPDR